MESLANAIQANTQSLMQNKEYREAVERMSKLSPEEQQAFVQKRKDEANRKDWEEYDKRKKEEYYNWSIWGGDGKQEFTFNRWNPELQSQKDEAKLLKDKAIELTKNICFGGAGKNILVHGNAGTGKTALVLSMIDGFKKRSEKTVMFVSTVALSAQVHNFYDKQVQERLLHTKELMKKADVLVLDDFGSESGGMSNVKTASEPLQRFYFEVAESRQAKDKNGLKRLTTIVTTNNTGKELAAMFNEKIISRLIAKRPENQLIFSGMDDLRE